MAVGAAVVVVVMVLGSNVSGLGEAVSKAPKKLGIENVVVVEVVLAVVLKDCDS